MPTLTEILNLSLPVWFIFPLGPRVHNVIIALLSSYAIRRCLYGNTWVSNSDP